MFLKIFLNCFFTFRSLILWDFFFPIQFMLGIKFYMDYIQTPLWVVHSFRTRFQHHLGCSPGVRTCVALLMAPSSVSFLSLPVQGPHCLNYYVCVMSLVSLQICLSSLNPLLSHSSFRIKLLNFIHTLTFFWFSLKVYWINRLIWREVVFLQS